MNLKTQTLAVAVVGAMLVGAGGTARAGIFDSSDYSGAGAYDYRMSSALHPGHKRHGSHSARRSSHRRAYTRHTHRRHR